MYVRNFVECVHRNALDLLNFDGFNSPHRTGLLGTFINIHDGIMESGPAWIRGQRSHFTEPISTVIRKNLSFL